MGFFFPPLQATEVKINKFWLKKKKLKKTHQTTI